MNPDLPLCDWLHEALDVLPRISFPFDRNALPTNGIYFFYENGESCSHSQGTPRIVRVGTHRDGNFQFRIAEHFLLDERKMMFTKDQPAPHDRSIFRKHIGRALLNRARDPYLSVWDTDFTPRSARDACGHLRDINKEMEVERQVTQIIRERFSFRFTAIADQTNRMGSQGLERALIGTLAGCGRCSPSRDWLGQHSPNQQIRTSGLWLIQHLRAAVLTSKQIQLINAAISDSRFSVSLP